MSGEAALLARIRARREAAKPVEQPPPPPKPDPWADTLYDLNDLDLWRKPKVTVP